MPKGLDAFFRFITKTISLILAFLFVLITSLVLLLFNAERSLMNAGTYKRALAENGVYQQLPALAEENTDAIKAFLTDQAGLASADMGFMNDLTAKDWQTLLSRVLPPDEARAMIENSLDQVFAVINAETDTARLSLVALKAHITGQAGGNLILQLLNTQPPCSEEQSAQIRSTNAGDTAIAPVFCSPQPADLARLTSQWQVKLESLAAGIPDEIILLNPSSQVSSLGLLGTDSIAKINTIRMEIRFSPLLPLGLLTLVTLLSIRSLNDWLRWWGIPLFITGLICAAFGFAILPLAGWAWINFMLPQFPSGASSAFTGLARNLVGSLGQALSTPIIVEAVIIALLGLAAIIGSFFVEPKRVQPVPLTSPPDGK